MVTTAGTPFGTVMGNIISGRAGGAWTGTGINSSAAAANPATSLGLMTGADYIAVTGGLTVFSGMSIVAGDSLIKYTWYGDANFDGEVNFDDYALTDFGYTSGLSGWVNGDFDYNGVIDFDDFVLIDLGFSSQSGILRNALAYLSGEDRSQRMDDPALRMVADHFQQFGLEYAQAFLSAAPEPGSAVGLIGLMTAGALSRRRRHQHN
jgi:hypothetical protein